MERAELARTLATAAPGFLPDLVAQIGGGGLVFLQDPGWGVPERTRFAELTRRVSGGAEEGWLMIPSGGTSGQLKLARHDEQTLGAAARGFAQHFAAAEVCSVGVLPHHHVSGLMAWVRCACSGGRYVPWDWKRLEAGEVPTELPPPAAGRLRSLSLVPTQLQRLLATPAAVEWLRQFDAIFLGGGAAWPALLDAAAAAGLPLSVGYGMTETAAMATGQLPGEFLAGDRTAGRPLPHIHVTVDANGLATLAGSSLFKGYYPEFDPAGSFATQDLVSVAAADGRVTVHGRRDAVITTGGKKVDPAEVEAALRATGLFSDLAVVGVPDAEWGETVVVCHPAADGEIPAERIAAL